MTQTAHLQRVDTPEELRGRILAALERFFGTSMAVADGLFRCLRIGGPAPAENDFNFQLRELAQGGYIEIFRADQMPGYPGRGGWLPPQTIMFVKLLPIGFRLLAGKGPTDPAVYIQTETLPSREDETEHREAQEWVREQFDRDMATITAASREGDALANEVIRALVIDGLIMDHQREPRARKRGGRRIEQPEQQRGYILSVLERYQGNGSSVALVNGIFNRLQERGLAKCGRAGLDAHLVDLSRRGYVQLFRAEILPGYRGVPFLMALQPDTILFAKLLPAGLALADGSARDPEVKF